MDNQNKRNKTIITKENLINMISKECNDDFISMEDLFKLIDKVSDEDGFVSKKKLIKSVRESHTKSVVKNVYNTLEHLLFKTLSETNKKHDVTIKMFEGVSLNGQFIPEKMKENHLTKQVNLVESHIKPKFNITRSYREKLNDK